MNKFQNVKALTFDLFGTVLDLGGSLTPYIQKFLQTKDSNIEPTTFWERWRYRQRIEQYQDTLVGLSHSGYLETSRRAFVYVSEYFKVNTSEKDVADMMSNWNQLLPFPEVIEALNRLQKKYKLVALSNGNRDYLDHLVKHQIKWDFDHVFSVDTVGVFKPHPRVYRTAAQELNLELGECGMISSNSFDVMGARTCGFRAAYVNRYDLPFEDTEFKPDMTVMNFIELADAIG